MRKIFIGGASRPSRLAALMAALLLCCLLSGCHNTPNENSDTEPKAPDTKTEEIYEGENHQTDSSISAGSEDGPSAESGTDSATEPDSEFDARFVKYRNDVARTVHAMQDPVDGGNYQAVWEGVRKIKDTVREWESEESSVTLETLEKLTMDVDDLMTNIDTALQRPDNPDEAIETLERLIGGAALARTYLNIIAGSQRDTIPPANVESAPAEENDSRVMDAVEGLAQNVSVLDRSVKDLQDSVDHLFWENDGGPAFPLWIAAFIIVGTALAGVGAAAAVLGTAKMNSVHETVLKMASYDRTPHTESSKGSERNQNWDAETLRDEKRQAQAADEDAFNRSSQNYRTDIPTVNNREKVVDSVPLDVHKMGSAAQAIKQFKTDSSRNNTGMGSVWLYEAYSHDEFSGTPVPGSLDSYYIWPDPWNLNAVPKEGQELKDMQRYNLYNRYVTKCFDITPNDPGNIQNFHLRLDQYAEIQKEGSTYRLIARGKITAFQSQ